ncbi:sulfite exporter TauE/SafE family protein [Desulfurispirillum indicum]|uniref:Probable membrane transporter protein n=1 Tax=Desulfurispirillum indicum (strain ATCC BAA-1389 / DSM 22839 / S5) TaxID=653733 RepID=E6W4P0_DESIS|nr:sulfite exporter TauE/SafE family protein [Desulfurispirillum indicum]ADU67113.1 protein of unknown function DUF81 [Desulfurispirillum indicum S5]UCZ56437.1 sulfite exporter TauE/SafE family protein [Desulfurispirillum indicum]
MDALSLEAILWVLSAVALAAFIHGALGIGFPMVVTPLIALVTDVQTAIIVTLVPNIVVNVMSIYRGGQWAQSIGRYWPLALFMLTGSVLGTIILVNSDPNPFRLILAFALFFYLYTTLRSTRISFQFLHRHPRSSTVGTGFVAGLLGGTVNVSGPILLIYLLELSLPPLAMVQILNLCFLVGKISQTITFASLGQISIELMLFSLPLLALSVACLLFGMRLRDRLPVATYKRWLHWLLAVVACLLVVQFFLQQLA